MRNRKNETFVVYQALTGAVSYHGDDHGYLVWSDVVAALKQARNELHDFEPLKSHDIEWSLIDCESPDVIYSTNDYVLGIECFKFDSSNNADYGSELSRSQRELEKRLLQEHYNTGSSYIVANNETNMSYEDYILSACKAINKHSSKIARYRENLKELAGSRNIYLAFFIDDTTILGNYAITERRKEEPLQPFCANRIIDLLEKCEGVDYFISHSQYDYYLYKTVIVENSKIEIDNLRHEAYNDDEMILTSEKSATISSIPK